MRSVIRESKCLLLPGDRQAKRCHSTGRHCNGGSLAGRRLYGDRFHHCSTDGCSDHSTTNLDDDHGPGRTVPHDHDQHNGHTT